jgi:hypothetical protein
MNEHNRELKPLRMEKNKILDVCKNGFDNLTKLNEYWIDS